MIFLEKCVSKTHFGLTIWNLGHAHNDSAINGYYIASHQQQKPF